MISSILRGGRERGFHQTKTSPSARIRGGKGKDDQKRKYSPLVWKKRREDKQPKANTGRGGKKEKEKKETGVVLEKGGQDARM